MRILKLKIIMKCMKEKIDMFVHKKLLCMSLSNMHLKDKEEIRKILTTNDEINIFNIFKNT